MLEVKAMYDEKASFIFYKEWGDYVRMLKEDEQGKLLVAIFDFQDTGKIPEFDGQLKIVFTMMVKQFERDSKKWIEKKLKRSQAGKIGAQARWDNGKTLDSIKETFADKFNL